MSNGSLCKDRRSPFIPYIVANSFPDPGLSPEHSDEGFGAAVSHNTNATFITGSTDATFITGRAERWSAEYCLQRTAEEWPRFIDWAMIVRNIGLRNIGLRKRRCVFTEWRIFI